MGKTRDSVTREMVIWKWSHQGNPLDSAMEKMISLRQGTREEDQIGGVWGP